MRVHLLTAPRQRICHLGGHPSKYYPGPMLLDFGYLMGNIRVCPKWQDQSNLLLPIYRTPHCPFKFHTGGINSTLGFLRHLHSYSPEICPNSEARLQKETHQDMTLHKLRQESTAVQCMGRAAHSWHCHMQICATPIRFTRLDVGL
jgi:hypothetical protein